MASMSDLSLSVDIASFDDCGEDELARWWCALNRGVWPVGFPLPEPQGEAERRLAVWFNMARIAKMATLKRCLWEWNRGRMTRAEFETWWTRHSDITRRTRVVLL